MPLPIKFSNVHYYLIAGQYTYAGELVLVQKTLYFFPTADLEQERNKRASYGSHFGLAGVVVGHLAARAINTGYGTYVDKHGLWPPGINGEQFRKLADEHLAQARADRTTATFSDLLPLPNRFQSDEISRLKLGGTGTLSFAAQSDLHDFKIGLRRKKQLRDAMWEAGFGQI